MNIGMNHNGELVESAANALHVIEIPDSSLYGEARFREMMMVYLCAMRGVKTKLADLNHALAIKTLRTTIQMLKSMRDKPASIDEKLKRRVHQ